MQPIMKMEEWERRVHERENAKPDPSRYTEEERALARELKEKRRILEQRQHGTPAGEFIEDLVWLCVRWRSYSCGVLARCVFLCAARVSLDRLADRRLLSLSTAPHLSSQTHSRASTATPRQVAGSSHATFLIDGTSRSWYGCACALQQHSSSTASFSTSYPSEMPDFKFGTRAVSPPPPATNTTTALGAASNQPSRGLQSDRTRALQGDAQVSARADDELPASSGAGERCARDKLSSRCERCPCIDAFSFLYAGSGILD